MVNLTNISHRILLQQQPKDHQTLPMKQSGMLLPCTKVLLLILTMSIPMSRSITISRGKSLAKKIKSTSFLSTQQQLLVRFPTSSFHKGSNIMMMPEGPEVRTLVDQLQPGVGLRLCDLHVSEWLSETSSQEPAASYTCLLYFCLFLYSNNTF